MDSIERVRLALSFKEPDRVPVDFWGSRGFYESLFKLKGISKEEFLDTNDVDFRYIEGPRYCGPDLKECDIWGVPRREVAVQAPHGTELYEEVAKHPLSEATNVAQIEEYGHWPSADWFDYGGIARQCEAVHEKKRVVVFMGDRLNRVAQLKPAMYLRGVEQIFTDLAMSPELADAIIRRIRKFYDEYLTRILEAARGGIDIVLTGDDFGSQHGPLISLSMWDRFLSEGFRNYLKIIRDSGAISMHHSCGMVAPLVSRFVDCRLSVLQSLQPEVMEPHLASLKKEFGRKLGFQGGISIQRTMPFGTRREIRAEVARRVRTLAQGGGYIFCTAHNVQADCPVENVDALFEAYRDYGAYS